jgi:hypothetical protein
MIPSHIRQYLDRIVESLIESEEEDYQYWCLENQKEGIGGRLTDDEEVNATHPYRAAWRVREYLDANIPVTSGLLIDIKNIVNHYAAGTAHPHTTAILNWAHWKTPTR